MTKRHHLRGDQLSFVFHEHSYESRLFYWLHQVNQFFEKSTKPYALFGGAAIAAYIGHLPRKLHDLDIIADAADFSSIDVFMRDNDFELQHTLKASKAKYRKYFLKNHIYEIIVSFFPGSFTLLDLNKDDLPSIGSYDFSRALHYAQSRQINSLGGQGGVTVKVIPVEDLIISKLWPTFEPNTVHDLLVLFASVKSEIDLQYIQHQICDGGPLGNLARESLLHFAEVYKRSIWPSLGLNSDRVEQLLAALIKALEGNKTTTFGNDKTTHSSGPNQSFRTGKPEANPEGELFPVRGVRGR